LARGKALETGAADPAKGFADKEEGSCDFE
jgi:hypothetical protein